MKAHRFADIFPMMDEKEYADLKKDIKENGLLEPIVITNNEILDGRNRFKACQELDITPEYEEYNGDNPLQYVVSKNLKRRHLTDSQKAVVALAYLPFYEEQAKERQGTRTDIVELIPQSDIGTARDKLGETFGVSGRYIDKAKKLSEKRPEILNDVREGKVSLSSAYGDYVRAESNIPEWQRFTDVWTFTSSDKEGISNLPKAIIYNVLHYYTKKGDTVVDCFAGSGITHEVCKDMQRTCLLYDINPRNENITKWNIEAGFPKETEDCDLIFLDPPYWNLVDYGENTWSKLKLSEFYNRILNLANDCKKVLKKGGKIAFIIMPVRNDGQYVDLGYTCYKIFQEAGFKSLIRLCVPVVKNWAVDTRLNKAKENNELMIGALRDLFIMEIENTKGGKGK